MKLVAQPPASATQWSSPVSEQPQPFKIKELLRILLYLPEDTTLSGHIIFLSPDHNFQPSEGVEGVEGVEGGVPPLENMSREAQDELYNDVVCGVLELDKGSCWLSQMAAQHIAEQYIVDTFQVLLEMMARGDEPADGEGSAFGAIWSELTPDGSPPSLN